MELKNFIEAALNEICDGIYLAKENQFKIRDNCVIAPGTYEGEKITNLEYISFELLVEIGQETTKGAGGKINVLSANIGGKLEKLENIKNVNKITFKVPYAPAALSPIKNKAP